MSHRDSKAGSEPKASALDTTFSVCTVCCVVLSCSVVSDSFRPHELQPTSIFCPWGFSRQEYWSGLPCPPPGNPPLIFLLITACNTPGMVSDPNVSAIISWYSLLPGWSGLWRRSSCVKHTWSYVLIQCPEASSSFHLPAPLKNSSYFQTNSPYEVTDVATSGLSDS